MARKTARYRAGKRLWERADDALLRRRYPHEPTAALAKVLGRSYSAVSVRARLLGVGKSAAFLASLAKASRLPVVGAPFRFQKGLVPANKGLRRPGWSQGRGRMQETQFKKGNRTGRANDVWKPIGSERISKDGYLERKINEDLPFQRRWRAVHLILWESIHGPLPKGHAVCFKNGDKTDIRDDNLELITRQALMARNTVHHLPKPLKSAIHLLGQLKRRIRERTTDGEISNRRSA